MKINKIRSAVGLVLLLGAGLVAAWFLTRPASSDLHSTSTVKPTAVRILRLKKRVIEKTVSTYGSVVSPKSVTVAALIAGTVVDKPLDDGQTVKKGDVLFRLKSSDVDKQLLNLNAQLTNARYLYQSYVKANRAVPGSVAIKTINQAKTNLQGAVSAYRTAKASLIVRAPIAGVTTDTDLNVGAHVNPGDLLVNIIDPQSHQIRYTLPSEYRDKVKRGQTVRFRPNDSRQVYNAVVSYVAPQLDVINDNIVLRANFTHSTALEPHVFGRLTQVLNPAYRTFTVNQEFVHADETGFFLYVMESGKVAKRYVTVGKVDRSGYVPIINGITAQDRVIVSDANALSVGQHVEADR